MAAMRLHRDGHCGSVTWSEYFHNNNRRVFETAELSAAGASWRALTAAVDNGDLLRARRGHYVLPDTERHTLEAVRVGGRLACISAAADVGVFAFDDTVSHIHLDPHASRLRTANDRFQRLNEWNREGIELHWDHLVQPRGGTEYAVGLVDALVQIFRCQQPNFAALPERVQYLRTMIDPRSEAGQKTVLRLILRAVGLDCEIQVAIDGVGRLDLLIAGCLVVEADSRKFHESWPAQARDRARDRNLATQEYMSYRALYRNIMFFPERVRAAILGLLAARNRFLTVIV